MNAVGLLELTSCDLCYMMHSLVYYLYCSRVCAFTSVTGKVSVTRVRSDDVEPKGFNKEWAAEVKKIIKDTISALQLLKSSVLR